jgi:hypothetical protein
MTVSQKGESYVSKYSYSHSGAGLHWHLIFCSCQLCRRTAKQLNKRKLRCSQFYDGILNNYFQSLDVFHRHRNRKWFRNEQYQKYCASRVYRTCLDYEYAHKNLDCNATIQHDQNQKNHHGQPVVCGQDKIFKQAVFLLGYSDRAALR